MEALLGRCAMKTSCGMRMSCSMSPLISVADLRHLLNNDLSNQEENACLDFSDVE
ncbi:hypothetical protein ACLOJK_018983 [Asimina triloba]